MVVELVPLMGGKKIQATPTKLYTSHPQNWTPYLSGVLV